MATEALIRPIMLRWARQRLYSRLDVAAEKLDVRPDRLAEWEDGESRPSFRQAQALARKLRIPFGYLYLSSPPEERLPLPDLRTKSGSPVRKPSPDFLEVLYDALRKQEWYHEYLSAESAGKVAFVGRFNIGSSPTKVAADISKTLGLNNSLRHDARNFDDFLNRLSQRAEAAGVMVMRNSVVANNTKRPLNPNEFQGFAISDDLAPLVFVNTRDFLAAQVFTLVHELAHIWMGVSGVSSIMYLRKPGEQPHEVERATDAIAAEVLVPSEDFDLRWAGHSDLDDALDSLSRHYCVSRFVILRRAYELDRIDRDTYHLKYDDLSSRAHPKGRESGGDFHKTLFVRNSATITSTLLHSVMEGRITSTEASRLLNIRALALQGLEGELARRSSEAQYA